MSEAPTPEKTSPGWRRWALEAAIFIVLLAAFQLWQTRHAASGPAPHFAGQQVDGRAFDLTAWRREHPGQAGLIYVWAEWCGICRTTAGTVSKLGQDWPLITVATQSGPADQVAATMRMREYDWPTVPDPTAEILRQYGLRGVPAFIVIDPSGNIRNVSLGYTSEIGLRLRLWWAKMTNA